MNTFGIETFRFCSALGPNPSKQLVDYWFNCKIFKKQLKSHNFECVPGKMKLLAKISELTKKLERKCVRRESFVLLVL